MTAPHFQKADPTTRLPRSLRWLCIACGRQPMNDEVSTEFCAPGEAAGYCPNCQSGSTFAPEEDVVEFFAGMPDDPRPPKTEPTATEARDAYYSDPSDSPPSQWDSSTNGGAF